MRPTCLQTFPATCPPRAPLLTDRMATSHQRAAAAISICHHQLVVSTCRLKIWMVNKMYLSLSWILNLFYMHIFLTRYCFFPHTGFCQLDTGSEADLEASIDPLLCHYQGPIGSLLHRDNMYSTDPTEVFTGLFELPWLENIPLIITLNGVWIYFYMCVFLTLKWKI